MYRLLSIKLAKIPNIRKGVVFNSLGRADLRIEGTKSIFLCRNIEKGLASPILKTASLIGECTIIRQSTTSNNLGVIGRIKRKRRCRPQHAKYVELLEVSNRTIEKKQKVKHLKAKRLQEFIESNKLKKMEKAEKIIKSTKVEKPIENAETTGDDSTRTAIVEQPIEYQKFNLENFDISNLNSGILNDKPLICFNNETHIRRIIQNPIEIQKILKSYMNIREILQAQEHVQNSDESFSTADVIEDDFIPFESNEPYMTSDAFESESPSKKTKKLQEQVLKKSKHKFKLSYHNEKQEKLAKGRAIRVNLSNYLRVCVSVGMLNRGFSTIMVYRQRAKNMQSNKANVITIDLYNILLHGFAATGNFDRFKQIFPLIQEDGLSFNEQTFAAIFECLGRLEASDENDAKIREYIEKSKDMGITLNQIMDRSKFIGDQREIVLNSIRRIHPNFTPEYTPPVLSYSNELLNDLNSKNPSDDKYKKKSYSVEFLHQCTRNQLKNELKGSITVKSIDNAEEYLNADLCREKVKELEKQWHSHICMALQRDLNTLRAQARYKPNGCMNFYTYLKALDIDQHANILLMEIYRVAESSETFSPTVTQLHKELGQKFQQRYRVEQKKKNGTLEKIGKIYGQYCEKWDESASGHNARQIWQQLVHENRPKGPSMDIHETSWSTSVLTGVGRFLYNILIRDIKIDAQIMRQNNGKTKNTNLLPAFYTLFRNHGRLVKEEVKPHPVLARLLRGARQQTITFDSNCLPMLCPPQPWSTPYNGGYLLNQCDLIRLPQQAVQQWDRIHETNPQNMYPSLDSLNQLASIPWRVNKDVLDIIIKVFQDGGSSKLDIPKPPASLPPLPTLPEHDASMSSADRAKQFKDKFSHRRKQAEMYSLWCDALYRLSLANHYRDKVFWLPHNMDFRGRVYSIPPHLSHLGSDMARSMLVFDQAKPLGVDGFSWLKLHCINLTGQMKRSSVEERLMYCEEVMEDILDSADKPMTGRMWWAESDEPWQTLACCFEIAKVHRSPNPETYMSHFPIHQDGSCNGLQHYAALGRDQVGAVSVNLSPSNTPQDVYSEVANLVENARKKDAENGLHVAQALENFVRRKVIKQTVMTTVYGVTRYGARLQIARQLKDIDNFPKDWVWPASTYLTTKTFESLCEMFTSTREIQDWFTECARFISGACGKNVEWCTPLGLPVVQPYNRIEFKYISPKSFGISNVMPTDLYERPNIMKQKNAFPPNFIHSLDSSHMMLTSLHCNKKGITFVSVHDCFWTHACTVPDMNKICREQFVALHSQPILQNLSKFLLEKYGLGESHLMENGLLDEHSKKKLIRLLTKLPKRGKFDLKNVLESVYFFC